MKRLILIGALALLSSTSFGSSIIYSGQGKETEFGIENCGMNVKTKANNLVDLQIFGLGYAVEITTTSSGKFKEVAETVFLPKSKAKVSGELLDGKPLSFTIKVDGEKMTCNF